MCQYKNPHFEDYFLWRFDIGTDFGYICSDSPSFLLKNTMTTKRNLVATTKELLAHRDRTLSLEKIAEDCNLTVFWLAKLLSKNPPTDPSAEKIQRLYEYLTGSDLL